MGRKTYTFPSRFNDVELLVARFLLPSSAVAEWLPRGLEPASLAGLTQGMVTVQHLGSPPDGMRPYTEASFAVKVITPDGSKGWHTLLMPVDSVENQQRGVHLLGLPKEMAELELSDAGRAWRGEVRSSSGKPLLSIQTSQINPLKTRRELDNVQLQMFQGRLHRLATQLGGDLTLAPARVSFGDELRRRFPGLPARPRVMMGGHLGSAKLSLDLPAALPGKEPTR